MNERNWRDDIFPEIEKLKEFIHVEEFAMYWVDKRNSHKAEMQTGPRIYSYWLGHKDHIVSKTIDRKQIILVRDCKKLEKTNPEIFLTYIANAVVCIPIINSDGRVLVVIEFHKTSEGTFSEKDLLYLYESVKWITIWLVQRIKCDEESNITSFRNIQAVYKLNYITGKCSYQTFLSNYMEVAREQLKADKCYMYNLNLQTGFGDLYEQSGKQFSKICSMLKYFKTGSYFYQIRETCKPMMVRIDDNPELLDKEIKQDPKKPLQYMLLYPLMFGGRYLGTLAFGNCQKENPEEYSDFSSYDQEMASKMTSVIVNSTVFQYILQQRETLYAHTQALREIFINLLWSRMKQQDLSFSSMTAPRFLHHFEWEPTSLVESNQTTYILRMFQAVYNFNPDGLKPFILCAQIAHRDYTYHNFVTTFYIVRTMYCVITKLDTGLKPNEKAALMIASVLYYANYCGFENNMLEKLKHYLTKLNTVRPKETHKIWLFQFLQNVTNLLRPAELKTIMPLVSSILFKGAKCGAKQFRVKIAHMLDTKTFHLSLPLHREYALLIIMRVAVHARHMQPYGVAKQLRDRFYEDVMNVGDLMKSKGFPVDDYRDRDMRHLIPEFEVQFLTNSVLPTFDLLEKIFPGPSLGRAMPMDILKAHRIIISSRNKTLWDPNACSKKKKKMKH